MQERNKSAYRLLNKSLEALERAVGELKPYQEIKRCETIAKEILELASKILQGEF